LVQGGSSSVGLFAVQLAKLIGYKVIATSSPHSFDLVKSYGADAVVDYHDVAEAVAQIKQVTGGGVAGALECIGGVPNGQLAVDSIREDGGLVTCLIAVPAEIAERRANVKVERIIMYTVFGYVSVSPGAVRLTSRRSTSFPVSISRISPRTTPGSRTLSSTRTSSWASMELRATRPESVKGCSRCQRT
jgi:NADPH:quinone reductase-like Zn-dependent oxidoreductase